MTLLNWPIENIQSVMLIFTRVAGIFISAPVLNSTRVPAYTKIGLSVLVAVILMPVVGSTSLLAKDALPFFALLVKEVAVGLTIGFVAALIFAAVQIAGEMADMQSGFAFAGMVDPNTGQRTSIIGQFQIMTAWLIFLAVDGHHVLLRGVADSFGIVPLASLTVDANIAQGIVGLGSRVFVIALQIGAPIIGAVLLGDLSIGLLSRTVPQMNILVLGFPVKMTLGLVMLIIALPLSLALERNLVYLIKDAVNHIMSIWAH